jgi:hypothetical protein
LCCSEAWLQNTEYPTISKEASHANQTPKYDIAKKATEISMLKSGLKVIYIDFIDFKTKPATRNQSTGKINKYINVAERPKRRASEPVKVTATELDVITINMTGKS